MLCCVVFSVCVYVLQVTCCLFQCTMTVMTQLLHDTGIDADPDAIWLERAGFGDIVSKLQCESLSLYTA